MFSKWFSQSPQDPYPACHSSYPGSTWGKGFTIALLDRTPSQNVRTSPFEAWCSGLGLENPRGQQSHGPVWSNWIAPLRYPMTTSRRTLERPERLVDHMLLPRVVQCSHGQLFWPTAKIRLLQNRLVDLGHSNEPPSMNLHLPPGAHPSLSEADISDGSAEHVGNQRTIAI